MLSSDLIAVHRRLRTCDDLAALLELIAEQAPAVTGFTTAHLLPAADDEPLSLDAIADTLGLTHWVGVAIVPDERALAVLVVDRSTGPPTAEDRAAVAALALVVSISLERLVLRRRAGELASEVRRFADLARALTVDVVDAAVALPTDHGLGSALPRSTSIVVDDPFYQRLSAREKRIAGLLVDGRSNREIADVLLLSPETVKTHITRLLRKLGAANRVEAVALLLGRT